MMPLLISALKSSPGLPGAGLNTDSPDAATTAATWAAAVGDWAAAIVPPSTTVAAAQSALQATLAGLFATARSEPAEVTSLAASLESAHMTFATTVGGGMAGYTPVPPTGLVGFEDILKADPRDSSQDAADEIADALDAWMKTGVSTLVAPPNTVVNWS